MGLNAQPSGERVHIGFFGLRNAGKSSVVNRVTGQTLSIVSDVKGTTTDPVQKAMELLPIGPVVIIDTPGIDDEGELGLKRVGKTRQVLNKADLAVLVVDAVEGISSWEEEMIRLFEKKEIPYLVVYNKMDLLTGKSEGEPDATAQRRGYAPPWLAGSLTAVFCANDEMAFGLIRALREAGLRVPDDVSVVGFDDIPLAEYSHPPLTTVSLDFERLGRELVRVLAEQLSGPAPASVPRVVLPTRLVVRATTGPPPRA